MIGCKCWSKRWNPLCCRRRRRSSCVAHCICETLPTVSALLDPKRRRARALFASWKYFETSSIVTHILVVIGNAFMYILLDITVQSHRSHPWREEKWIERSPRKIPRCCQQARNGPGWNQEKEESESKTGPEAEKREQRTSDKKRGICKSETSGNSVADWHWPFWNKISRPGRPTEVE